MNIAKEIIDISKKIKELQQEYLSKQNLVKPQKHRTTAIMTSH